MIRRVIIFGATGDLVGRYLMPALAQLLLEAGLLPDGFSVTGGAVDEIDTAAFRDRISERLPLHAPSVPEETRAELVRRLDYQPTRRPCCRRTPGRRERSMSDPAGKRPRTIAGGHVPSRSNGPEPRAGDGGVRVGRDARAPSYAGKKGRNDGATGGRDGR